MEHFRQMIEEAKHPVYNFINHLFDVSPPEPILYIGTSKLAKNESAKLSVPPLETSIPLYYSESDRMIAIDSSVIIENGKYARRAYKLNINPRYSSIRYLAAGYAGHCHSFLHNFQLSERTRGHAEQVAYGLTDSPKNLNELFESCVKMALPSAKMGGILLMAFLKVATKESHRDDYLAEFRKMMKVEKGALHLLINGRDTISPYTHVLIAVRTTIPLSLWLAEQWTNIDDARIKELVRSPLTSLDDKEVKESIGYLMGE